MTVQAALLEGVVEDKPRFFMGIRDLINDRAPKSVWGHIDSPDDGGVHVAECRILSTEDGHEIRFDLEGADGSQQQWSGGFDDIDVVVLGKGGFEFTPGELPTLTLFV